MSKKLGKAAYAAMDKELGNGFGKEFDKECHKGLTRSGREFDKEFDNGLVRKWQRNLVNKC